MQRRVRIPIGLILCCICFFNSACRQRPAGSTASADLINTTDSFSYDVFKSSEDGYGFNVLNNNKVYIHQPFIPTWPGRQAFGSEEEAGRLARFVVKRLEGKAFYFLLTRLDVDTLLKRSALKVADAWSDSESNNIKYNHASVDTPIGEAVSTANLPLLPDTPLKSRWLRKGTLPFGARSALYGFSCGTVVYVGGGEFKDHTVNDFWGFNAVEEWWTCLAELPGGNRENGISFSIGAKGYLGLGATRGMNSNTFKNDFYAYDPATNTWQKKANFPGTPRIDAASFTINGKGYVGSGYDEKGCSDFYEYDPVHDRWKKIAALSGGPLSAALGISTGNKGFIVCGGDTIGETKFLYEYIPAADTWERRKDFPGPARYFLNGYGINADYFIAGNGGAEGGEKRFRDFYLYSVKEDTWQQIPDYPMAALGKWRGPGGEVNGKIYMGGGYNGFFLNDWSVFEYYFAMRTDTGAYTETACYPLHDDSTWALYQECTAGDCYAGAALKTKEALGDFCYASHVRAAPKEVMLSGKRYLLLPRTFRMQTAQAPKAPVSLRLFFTRAEIEQALSVYQKRTGMAASMQSLLLLQYNGPQPGLLFENNRFDKNNSVMHQPRWYRYGAKDAVLVAEFPAAVLRSELYLLLPL